MKYISYLTASLCVLQVIVAEPLFPRGNPFGEALTKRQSQDSNNSSLEVDLGYSVYVGAYNATTDINSWKGIRFAAPPVSSLRWQAPQPPVTNRSSPIQANSYAPYCPQSEDSSGVPINATADYSTEDCLYLNVYSPANATADSKLPVLVWIHGGGYGAGNGRQDLSAIIQANHYGFVGVSIQYRLGAFGFLSSDEVFRRGVVNAGLLDQQFALQWVQAYVSQFGGDPTKVTISGESAGGGSVMVHVLSYGGILGSSLFRNAIVASPYLPMQYGYKDFVPSQSYYAFATMAGCPPVTAYGGINDTYPSIFSCLVNQTTETLQTASFNISASGTYGTWGFLPVTDGTFLPQLPSQQLLQKKVNGLNLLSGNNANEGFAFTPQNIVTEDDLIAWLQLTFPNFSDNDIAKLLLYYPSTNASVDPSTPLFSTTGTSGPTALNESEVGTGQQQRADNIYAETTFVCPSYWLAEAFSDYGRQSWKYQYSVPVATHGADVTGYFGPATPNQGPDFELAFMNIWGNFVTQSNPSIPSSIANGASSGSSAANPAASWPPFDIYNPQMLNLNETGGVPYSVAISLEVNVTQFQEPGLMNDFSLVNAYTWEGGRGFRCDYWRSVGLKVPE